MRELYLNTWQVSAVLLILVWIAVSGRVAWALGIYCAMPSWLTVVRFGSINHLYILFVTLAISASVYYRRHADRRWLPYSNRWIIPLLAVWVGWISLMVSNNNGMSEINDGVMQTLLLYILLPLPFFLLIAKDHDAECGFAWIYVFTMAIGGINALSRLETSLGVALSQLASDPLLTGIGSSGVQWIAYALGLANWHWFAYGCSIALLLLITLWAVINMPLVQVALMPLALFLVYLLLLVGSRQATAGAVIVGIFLVLWLKPRFYAVSRVSITVTAVAMLSTIVATLTVRPELLLRNYASLQNAFNPFIDRATAWEEGWDAFLQSPIWGDWFTGSPSLGHNYFISTLANQGLIGAAFLTLVLAFVVLQIRGIRQWSPHRISDVWRMTFFAIGLFSFLTGQVSGSPVSNWPIAWAAAVLWKYQDLDGIADGVKAHRRLAPQVLQHKVERLG